MAEPHHTIAPPGLTLEAAIERTGRPIKPLFEAAAAWRAVEMGHLAGTLFGRIVPEHERIRLSFERERSATSAHFTRSLDTGALTARVRPWDQIGAPLSPLRPDEASQLSIEVDASGKSLSLHGPGGGRLFALFWPNKATRSASKRTASTPGPKPAVTERVAQKMRTMSPALLRSTKITALAQEFGVSRDTVRKALETVGIRTPTNSDTK